MEPYVFAVNINQFLLVQNGINSAYLFVLNYLFQVPQIY